MRMLISFILSFFFLSANAQLSKKKIARLTEKTLLSQSILSSAHIGISIYDLEKKEYIYELNPEKYFIPASNTKLFTLYAGMKYLGDSITGAYYRLSNDTIYVLPAGDPTYLHPDFNIHPVHDFLNNSNKKIVVIDNGKDPVPYGKGWAWDDQQENYMPQRSALPGCGNLLHLEWIKKTIINPDEFQYDLAVMNTDIPDFAIEKKTDTGLTENTITRVPGTNHFAVMVNNKLKSFTQDIPFETMGKQAGFMIWQHSLYHMATLEKMSTVDRKDFTPLRSQKSDSVFSMMMHRSDNFYAEQTLLMAANEKLGHMDEKEMIDTLLNSDMTDIPQRPRWVDGSGLSRYNLFSPRDFIYILDKLQREFGMNRLTNILPTGGTGTLKNHFQSDSNFIFAKTGSMSNQFCLSGIFYNESSHPFLFSVMLNNFPGKAAEVRKAVEKYLTAIMHMKHKN